MQRAQLYEQLTQQVKEGEQRARNAKPFRVRETYVFKFVEFRVA